MQSIFTTTVLVVKRNENDDKNELGTQKKGEERKLKIEQRKIVIVAKCFCGNYSIVAAGVKKYFL